MGVEYERWLIAKGNVFLPSAAAIAKLVERLRKEQWIPDPAAPEFARLRFPGRRARHAAATGGYAVRTVENTFGDDLAAKLAATTEPQPRAITAGWLDHPDREELRLVWPVEGDEPLPVKYPLSRKPDGGVAYSLELHRAPEYVYPISETIEPVPTVCACGEDLAFHWDDDEVVAPFGASSGIFAECEACSRTFDPSKGAALVTNPFDGTASRVPGGAAYRFALKVDCGKCFAQDDPQLAFAPELVALVEDEFGRAFSQVGSIY
ncbi:MAG TPA: hypothetical protein VIF15_15180 [Polyangiaceae bacterium]|jgi:hypothetical protein